MSDHQETAPPAGRLTPALEKGPYPLFVRHATVYRAALIPSTLTDLSALQLPNLSTLHTCNHFLDYSNPKDDINPDMHNPFIVNEQWPIYLQHCLTLPGPNTAPFPVSDHYVYNSGKYKAAALAFFHHQPKIRRLLSEAAVSRLTNALVLNEYAALNHVRLTGQLATYRHFDIILRTVLDRICNSRDQRNHFIQFPISSRVYNRTQFLKTFLNINTSTLRIQNDPSYYLLIHLLGFVYGVSAEPTVPYPPVDLVLHPDAKDTTPLTSTSLFARLPDDILSRINLVLTHSDNSAIFYNLATLKEMAEHPSMFLRVLRHINTLKLSQHVDSVVPEDDVDDVAFDDHMVVHQELEPADAPLVTTPPVVVDPEPVAIKTEVPVSRPIIQKPAVAPVSTVKPPVVVEKTAPQKAPFDFHSHVATHLETKLKTTPDQQDLAPMRVEDLYRRHLAVTIAGQSIADYLDKPLEDIHTNTLDFLDGKLPDPTMSTSSIANFDTLYIKSGFHHDLAKTLTSMVAHGMFVTHVDEIPQVTQWSRRTVYKVALVDLAGKRHSLVFAFPQVSNTGQMLINGVASRMTKQQINLPICKIGEDRVNLSSNYNKTLLERVSTRRHSFSSYFTKYLTMLRIAKLVTAHYGKLSNSPIKLPYDYSAIGQTYTRIEGSDGVLVFDYPNRFTGFVSDEVGTESYTEEDSIFEHDNRDYSLATLLEETENLPVQQFKVSDLAWVLENNPPDPSRSIDDTDLTTPILVTDWHGKLVAIDGAHRLAKAIKLGQETILGRLVPQEMLKRHLIGVTKLSLKALQTVESRYGVFCGQTAKGILLFMGMDNKVVEIDPSTLSRTAAPGVSIINFLHTGYPTVTPPPMVSEWTELNVLSENFPTIFVLGFRFGLTAVLKDAHIQTTWVPETDTPNLKHDDLVIDFADGSLVINRYPLKDSLLVAGLLKFSTKTFYRAEFDSSDVYYRLLMQAGISINYLKGINSFFDFFLDPITLDVLHEMGEPTTVRGLLLRANEMVSTYDHYPAASMRNHRLRGYERFSSVLYNEMSRQLAAYQGKRQSKKSFSINPEAVFQRIMQDSTISTAETINPISEIKDNTGLTYAGSGARTAQSFVVEDRRYPDDGVGVLSEATPDSGKVALNAYTSSDPKLANLRGMFDYNDPHLTPSNILSSTSLLLPGSVQDD